MNINIIRNLLSFFLMFISPNIMHFLLGMCQDLIIISHNCHQLFLNHQSPKFQNFFLSCFKESLLLEPDFGQWLEIMCLESLIYCLILVLERNYLLCLKQMMLVNCLIFFTLFCCFSINCTIKILLNLNLLLI